MRDVRVTVEANGEHEQGRVQGTDGEVAVGGATFRFSVSGAESETDTEGAADTDADAETATDGEDSTGNTPRRVAPVGDVPADGTLLCEGISGDWRTEFILRRVDGEVAAWRNACPHEPDVRLDRGGGAIVSEGELVCHKHGARFECGDGLCTAGPCRGDELAEIDVEVRDGTVYLTDERFDAGQRVDR